MKKLLKILLCAMSFYGCTVSYIPDPIYDRRPYVSPYMYPYVYYPHYYYYHPTPPKPNPYYHPSPNIHYGPRGGSPGGGRHR
jgi:hypothetical protein